jgi:hypothetical protein
MRNTGNDGDDASGPSSSVSGNGGPPRGRGEVSMSYSYEDYNGDSHEASLARPARPQLTDDDDVERKTLPRCETPSLAREKDDLGLVPHHGVAHRQKMDRPASSNLPSPAAVMLNGFDSSGDHRRRLQGTTTSMQLMGHERETRKRRPRPPLTLPPMPV